MPLIQTHRLTLRRMSLDDRAGIAAILQVSSSHDGV